MRGLITTRYVTADSAMMEIWHSIAEPATATEIQTDGVDGPLTASECQNGGRRRSPGMGAIHERDYDDWAGSGQERLSGPWRRCHGCGGLAQASAPRPGARILCRLAVLFGWH